MNRTKIDWPGLTHTWNPVVGCKTNCPWCYAKRLNTRFKWIKKWDEPQFFPERLTKPAEVKKPSRIFVGSMCDLFGPWVPDHWIWQILDVVKQNKHHEFWFLSKYPDRYYRFKFPDNVWVGTSVSKSDEIGKKRLFSFGTGPWTVPSHGLDLGYFVSVEPLLGSFEENDFNVFDLIIVGAMTGPGAVIPKKEWIESIDHFNVYFKNNIKKYL